MDPQTGRFVSEDQLPGRDGIPCTFHRFIYARESPVKFLDPTGLEGIAEQMAVVDNVGIQTTMAVPRFSALKILGIGLAVNGMIAADILQDIKNHKTVRMRHYATKGKMEWIEGPMAGNIPPKVRIPDGPVLAVNNLEVAWYTPEKYEDGHLAESKLALPATPNYYVEISMSITGDQLSFPFTPAEPQDWGLRGVPGGKYQPGTGLETWTTKIINTRDSWRMKTPWILITE